VITALEAAWVTISTRHPEVPAAVVVTGTGDSIAIGNRVVRRVEAVFASRAR
jgi:hypothetical protein